MSTEPYYQDELVTLYHGDCLEITEWLSADVLVTDPPYGIGWRIGGNTFTRGGRAKAPLRNDHDTSTRDGVLALWGDTRPGVVFGAWSAPFPLFKQVLVWQKPANAGVIGSTTGYRRDSELIFLTGQWPRRTAQRSSVIATSGSIRAYLVTDGHPHAKPVSLMSHLLEWTQGTVADPFAGSGSTLMAARCLGRHVVGVELEEKFCELAAKRLQDQPVLVH